MLKSDQFSEERQRLQDLLQRYAGREMQRFLTHNPQAHEDGAARTFLLSLR